MRKSTPHAPDAPPWAARLRAAREATGLSATRFARELNIPLRSYAECEAGLYTPSVERALVIARRLGMTVEDLFGEGERNSA